MVQRRSAADRVGATGTTSGWIMSGSRPRGLGLSRPVYKPEFWDKVQELDQWTNKEDPIMTCQPMGIPREGTPRRIFQTVNDITMLYTTSDYGGGNREFRVDPNRRPQARPKEGARGHLQRIYRGALGG